MKKQLPEFREILVLTNSVVWKDQRDGASAIVANPVDGVQSRDLTCIFKTARHFGLTIDRKRPLIVYGTHCAVGESKTFQFIQITPRELNELDGRLDQATAYA